MNLILNDKQKKIIDIVQNYPALSSSEIHKSFGHEVELITIKRQLSKLVTENLLTTIGSGRGTKYVINPAYKLFLDIDVDKYFEKEIDQRTINEKFNLNLITETLPKVKIFTVAELEHLNLLQKLYSQNISQLSPSIYKQELERLSIDLSWKSSQIEGNTYSLLETEQLLKEQKEAKGKKKEEAVMLLNHKVALDYLIDSPEYINPLTLAKIEEIHSLLVKNLIIDTNIRKRIVGISGTNYRPLDNEFQIRDSLIEMCDFVNSRNEVFEKALSALLLISYIQPFADGNKRTSRIISNAILICNNYCPLSFRTVDSIEYKKAMLLFYEQNNINAFKKIFIDQYKFAVHTYFQ